jgi:hypothetical protein
LTTRTCSSGRCSRSSAAAQRLERRDVAGAAEHDVRLAPSSLLAHSQMPMPRVQCAIASSIGR